MSLHSDYPSLSPFDESSDSGIVNQLEDLWSQPETGAERAIPDDHWQNILNFWQALENEKRETCDRCQER